MKTYNKIITGLCILSIIGCGVYVEKKYADRDTKAPQINFEEDSITKSVKATTKELLQGVNAKDDVDGDVTDSILIENIIKKENTKNEFDISYIAFDKAGNCGEAKRMLKYEDYYGPRFSIKQPLRFPLNAVSGISELAQAYDCFDADLTPYILVEGMDKITSLDAKEGSYECTFKVKNSVGDTSELPVSIELYNSDSEEMLVPQIILSDYAVYVSQGENFNYKEYIKNIQDSGTTLYVDDGNVVEVTDASTNTKSLITEALAEGREGNWINISEINFETDLDVNVPGKYTGTYSYESSKTGLIGKTTIYIIVE